MSLRDRLTWRTESLCARMSCRIYITAVSAANWSLAFLADRMAEGLV